MYAAAMTYAPSGHVEQLPSGSWRAKVYAGKDPLTGREIRFRKTRRTEVEAQQTVLHDLPTPTDLKVVNWPRFDLDAD
jgi:hypothetical protein